MVHQTKWQLLCQMKEMTSNGFTTTVYNQPTSGRMLTFDYKLRPENYEKLTKILGSTANTPTQDPNLSLSWSYK